jgi:glycine cleavage system P protein (glycine dehydrogenase) subunit 1
MRYIPNTPTQQREMLATIGASSIEDLLARIPPKARLSRPLNVPAALAETDLVRHLRGMAARNADAESYACFLGGGAYDHTIPSPISHLVSRGEFFTAYTPYELTGMDVANASVYDGGSALAEAVLMAASITGRDGLALSAGVHPLYRQVAETYGEGPVLRFRSVALDDGVTDLGALRKAVGDRTAAVAVQYPNFFGCLEDLRAAADIVHGAGGLLIVVADPVNLGVLEAPGAMGADIVVGEGQGLGVPMSYGGPNLGVFATRQALVRRMPGRLAGQTVDLDGKRGFVLTLQTREQHIRRAKATSNICTNVALCALMATISVAVMGKHGLRKLGELATAKAHYAAETLTQVPGVRLRHRAPFFKEFTLELPRSAERVVKRLMKERILAGIPLKRFDRTARNALLVAVTEKRTRAEIDAYAAALARALA